MGEIIPSKPILEPICTLSTTGRKRPEAAKVIDVSKDRKVAHAIEYNTTEGIPKPTAPDMHRSDLTRKVAYAMVYPSILRG